MPGASRLDRQYCSPTCRQKVYQWWRSPEGVTRKQADAERLRDPELLAWVATMKAMDPDRRSPEAKAKAELEQRARSTGDVCGECGTSIYASESVYRAPRFVGRAYPTCFTCRCHGVGHNSSSGRCDECQPGGTWAKVRWFCSAAYSPTHPSPYCANCHPKAWRLVQPCEGCGRGVFNHIALRPGYRRLSRGWYATGHYAEPALRVFCSDRCARTTFNAESKAKRADRDPVDCPACGERVDSRRRDSRYCSSACRQRAYRARARAGAAA